MFSKHFGVTSHHCIESESQTNHATNIGTDSFYVPKLDLLNWTLQTKVWNSFPHFPLQNITISQHKIH